ncbi:MAG TPA: FAD-dependent monooxygenase [Steroidobacteraceae bacterium]|nr:FAD-dependent monooxygenase [Steroidobacteraceae bacterium]
MSSAALDCDVLIVGAGPVGLFLAHECARRGLRWHLVEMRDGQSVHSKALALFPRTLEIFDMAGLGESFLAVANRVTRIAVVTPRKQLTRVEFAPAGTPYPFVGMVPQDVTERILADALLQAGGRIEYQTKFICASQHDDCARVTLDRNGETSELTAAFVVGCDGAHSAVRHALDLPFAGGQYKASFMLADVDTNEALPADEMQLCPSALGPLAIFPMSATRRRIVATIEEAEGDIPSLELVRRVLAERAPAGIAALSLRWSSYFRIHRRQAAKLRVGRMFVAGDAAHVHSPFGGQGMNTGLQDAWNLAWKLDLAVRGRGNERLLDSYSLERRPVIRNVIATTDFLTRALGTASRPAQAMRNLVLPIVSRLPAFRQRFIGRLSELDIGYAGSPIVAGRGRRYFDDSMRGGKGIGGRFLLVVGQQCPDSLAEAARQFAASRAELLELRSAPGTALMLIRPDGYVAQAAAPSAGGAEAALESIRSILQRQSCA